MFAFLLALCALLLSGQHVCRDTGTQILTGNKVIHKHVLTFIIMVSIDIYIVNRQWKEVQSTLCIQQHINTCMIDLTRLGL